MSCVYLGLGLLLSCEGPSCPPEACPAGNTEAQAYDRTAVPRAACKCEASSVNAEWHGTSHQDLLSMNAHVQSYITLAHFVQVPLPTYRMDTCTHDEICTVNLCTCNA